MQSIRRAVQKVVLHADRYFPAVALT